MSKMDRMLNSKKEKQTIYEIYRACRLCGAGAGYKMPIIQNVVDLDDTDVELKQKIRECVQIEVHQDDKMPPLICELCVDKVNDFYEFLEMCRQTNKRTRLRLGLPPQSMPGGAPDAGDCILGLTEPVYVNEDSDIESLSKHKKTGREYKSNVKIKKEPQVKVESRSSRFSKREPTPPRMLRNSRNSREDSSLSRSQERSSKPSPKVSSKASPKSILKKTEDTSMLSPRLKRTRDKVPVKLETPVKKVKIATSPPTKSKSREVAAGKGKPSPPRAHTCSVCACSHKTPQALASHVKTHAPTLTSRRLACDPCREWFPSAAAACAHHRRHGGARPYRCQRCHTDHRTLTAYDEHIANEECVPWPVVPDVKCESCWHMFATNNLLEGHRCLGEDHRPGGKCSKCNRNYALLKNLKKHESTCTAKKKGEAAIDPALLAKLKPIQVRVSRCDPLLRNAAREHYDVSSVAADFGLDKNCVYPYISSFSGLRIKSELDAFRGMVAINEEIKEEFCAEEYVHWDSEESDSDNDISLLPLTKQIDSLATLTLKTIFSRKCLGRVPRKRRRVKQEKIFDSLLNDTEDDVTRDINNIIDNLDNDDDFNDLDGIERGDFDDSGLKDKDKVLDTNGDQNDSNTSKVCGDSKSLNNENNDGTIIKNNDDTQNDECPKINSHDKDISLGDTLNNSDDKIDNDNEEKSQKENLTVDSSKITKVEIEGINKNDNGSQSSDAISDEHKINNNVREDCQNNNENSDGNSKNDDNSKECKDIVSNDSQKSKDTSDDHQMNDENSDEHINNDDNTDDVKEENKVTDDTKHNDAQINDEIANNQQNNKDISNDVTSDFQDNLDDSDLKNKLDESTDGISKVDTNDDLANVGTDDGRANVDATDDGRANPDATDDFLSKVDKSDDCRENVVENNDLQINDEISKDSQIPVLNNDENAQLGELESQDSNSVTFNENLLNDDLKNECVNEENKSKMAANEHFSQDFSANGDPKSVDHEKINGDSINGQVFDNTDKIKSAEDIDDSKLMAALDAQIGECENSDVHEKATESYGFNDKIALEDLITDKNTTKPMDLDILPDEFNFDN